MPKAPIPMGALNFNPPLPETKASSKEVNLHPRFCVFLAVFHVLCDVMVHGAAFYLAFFRSPVYRTFNMLSFAHWEKFPMVTLLRARPKLRRAPTQLNTCGIQSNFVYKYPEIHFNWIFLSKKFR